MLTAVRSAAATSRLPSPSKSPTATDLGVSPAAKMSGAWKEPSPFPRRMLTLALAELATTRSSTPSPLKSPTSAAAGESTGYAMGGENPSAKEGAAAVNKTHSRPMFVCFLSCRIQVFMIDTPRVKSALNESEDSLARRTRAGGRQFLAPFLCDP